MSESIIDPDELARTIAEALAEPNIALIKTIIDTIGPEQAQAHLAQAQEIEASGGMLTTDGSRRRTPGGVFFSLARKAMPWRLRHRLWPMPLRRPRPDQCSDGSQPGQPSAPAAPIQALTWEEAKQLINQVM